MAHLCALFASGLDNGVKFLPRQSHNNQPTGKNDDDQKYHAGDKPGLHKRSRSRQLTDVNQA
jgi:hypothetical protein